MDKRSLLFMLCVSLAFFGVHFFFDQKPPTSPEKSPPIVEKRVHREITQSYLNPSYRSENETFYVLENDYQQLVFSDLGGSLAEINLPLKQTSEKSYVKEIDFDREILKNSPQNDLFPLKAYKTPNGGEVSKGKLGGYYPLLRRPIDNSPSKPQYYAMSIHDAHRKEAISHFQMTRFEENLIEFQGTVGSSQVTKTYTIPKERNGPYCFNLDISIEGSQDGLWLFSGVPDVEIVANSYSPLLRLQVTNQNSSDVETIKLPKKGPLIAQHLAPNWISNCNGFFGVLMDPLKPAPPGYKVTQIPGDILPTRLTLVDPGYQLYKAADYPGYASMLPLLGGETLFRIFAGPYDNSLLKDLDELYDEPLNNYNPEYNQALSMRGWFSFISEPFSKFLFFLMQLFYTVTRSWAASIILLTIALRAMMYPLNNWSTKSMVKMQEISPKIKALQEKYKNDPKRYQAEMVQFYKKAGVNPFVGCLPMLLQMPFLFGMFYLLKSSFPLRGAMFIPGWIDDLSAPDILFSWGQPLFLIGNELHLLPILMGLTMFLQQRFMAKPPKDPNNLTDQEKQSKVMGNMMALLFTFLFYNFPSGLNIYFMFSTLLGIAQQAWVQKKMKMTSS